MTRSARAARLRFLRSPGWLAAIIGAIVFAALCFTVLAPWQFSRHAERTTRNAQITAALTASPVPADLAVPIGAGGPAVATWTLVTATGQFLADRQVVVGLRQDGAGRPAGEVIAPLLLSDGSVLLVDRGYLLVSALKDGAAPPPPPAGTVTVTGRVQPFQPDPSQRAPERVGQRTNVYGIAADSVASLPGPVRGGFIQLIADAPGVLDPIGVPQRDSGPFLAYALQWLVFGAVAIGGIGLFVWREASDPRPPDQPDGGPVRPSGRPDARNAADPERRPTPSTPTGFRRSQLYDILDDD